MKDLEQLKSMLMSEDNPTFLMAADILISNKDNYSVDEVDEMLRECVREWYAICGKIPISIVDIMAREGDIRRISREIGGKMGEDHFWLSVKYVRSEGT